MVRNLNCLRDNCDCGTHNNVYYLLSIFYLIKIDRIVFINRQNSINILNKLEKRNYMK